MAEKIKFCIYCGTRNLPEALFCNSCGKKFIDEPIPPVPFQTVPPPLTGIFTLSCPTCGASLQITPAINRFTCRFCGNEHLVRRGDGYATIEPVLKEVQAVHQDVIRIQQSGDAIIDQVFMTARSAQEAQSAANLMAQRGTVLQQISLLDRSIEDKKKDLLEFDKHNGSVFIGIGAGTLLGTLFLGILKEFLDSSVIMVIQLVLGGTGFILLIIGIGEAAGHSSKKPQINAIKAEIVTLEDQIAQLRRQLR